MTEMPDLDREMGLQMAFKAINDTAGPDGLVPTLLVFGAYPRMTESSAPSPTVAQRASAIKKAMAEIQRLRAERQVADALAMRNGPSAEAVYDLPLNSPVLVWREGNTGQPGHWDGPFPLLAIEGESCTIKLPAGPTTFRSTVVKPYYTESAPRAASPEAATAGPPAGSPAASLETGPPEPTTGDTITVELPPKRGRGRPRKYPILTAVADVTVYLQDQLPQFVASRQKEITGLLDKGVFEIVQYDDIPKGARLFNSRFVDEIKNQGTDRAFEKSRLVVQAYNDQEKELVLTQSPTIQRVS